MQIKESDFFFQNNREQKLQANMQNLSGFAQDELKWLDATVWTINCSLQKDQLHAASYLLHKNLLFTQKQTDEQNNVLNYFFPDLKFFDDNEEKIL